MVVAIRHLYFIPTGNIKGRLTLTLLQSICEFTELMFIPVAT